MNRISRRPPGDGPLDPELEANFPAEYAIQATTHALQYYTAGRFAVAAILLPVSAPLLHHAVELLLKACLARGDSAATIRRYWKDYGHDLRALWEELERRGPIEDAASFREAIDLLNPFWELRYPEDMISKGALIAIGMYETSEPAVTGFKMPPERVFLLALPVVDRLVRMLCARTDLNPLAFRFFSEHAWKFYGMHNHATWVHPVSPPPDQELREPTDPRGDQP